ncbi:hypothetical protein EC957_009865 [Mortierella hygrophila]|uniref:Uncharacterized protein n=1 Tax=Mortierella hygrophila TaxID=979708 RepID=A0A9P6JXS7_9FUNG|nr:hypothetical protein EC957_009865 [Mortierella hygrophila]
MTTSRTTSPCSPCQSRARTSSPSQLPSDRTPTPSRHTSPSPPLTQYLDPDQTYASGHEAHLPSPDPIPAEAYRPDPEPTHRLPDYHLDFDLNETYRFLCKDFGEEKARLRQYETNFFSPTLSEEQRWAAQSMIEHQAMIVEIARARLTRLVQVDDLRRQHENHARAEVEGQQRNRQIFNRSSGNSGSVLQPL